tara:strand:- start:175 stop:732 length:558 start_codon:yes stop_codon:yes gene_type:complete
MAFWAEPGMEPKRAYRWLMDFGVSVGGNKLSNFLVKKISPRPSWSLTETKHNFLNHTFYYPGRVEYDELSVTIVDALEPNGVELLQSLLRKSGYHLPDEAENNFGTVSKNGWVKGATLGDVTITQLDPAGKTTEEWHLVNTWIKACKYGDLDYESDDLLNIELTLRYDYFKMDDNIEDRIAALFS